MNIAHLRQEYMRAGLAEGDAHADPLAQFQRWFHDAQAAELPLANAMTLATVSADGAPTARVVRYGDLREPHEEPDVRLASHARARGAPPRHMGRR